MRSRGPGHEAETGAGDLRASSSTSKRSRQRETRAPRPSGRVSGSLPQGSTPRATPILGCVRTIANTVRSRFAALHPIESSPSRQINSWLPAGPCNRAQCAARRHNNHSALRSFPRDSRSFGAVPRLHSPAPRQPFIALAREGRTTVGGGIGGQFPDRSERLNVHHSRNEEP